MKKITAFLSIFLSLLFLISCSKESNPVTNPPFKILKSDLGRDLSPDVQESDFSEMLDGARQFALDLYRQLRDSNEGNFFYSPYSISIALAMTYAGARENTALEMADALNFTLSQDKLHPAFNKLDLILTNLGQNTGDEEFILSVANSIWGEQTYSFLDDFLDILAVNYGAAMYLMDFKNKPDESRRIINAWVEDQTNDKIKDLLGPGTITSITRLVLTNAVYFYGSWIYQFNEENTTEENFTLLNGSQVSVPMMKQEEHFSYSEGEGYQAVELPYEGGAAGMLIIVPDINTFEIFEQNLDNQVLSDITNSLEYTNINLNMPKWEFKSDILLKDTLRSMGMNDAFLGGTADFSGIDGTFYLFITDVIHQAFVSVDESGTEAAAATAVIVGETSLPPEPVIMHINKPFIFLIRDSQTGTILFAGRVLNPANN